MAIEALRPCDVGWVTVESRCLSRLVSWLFYGLVEFGG